MQRDGLVVRRADPADARRARVHLTPRARALEDVLVSSARHVNAIATRTLPATDRVRLLTLLRAVIAALESERSRAAGSTVAASAKPRRAPARRTSPHSRRA